MSNSASSTKQKSGLCYIIFKSSLGKKVIMAISGIFLCLFLVGHLLGNMLLYVSPQAFNGYSDSLTSTSLIYIIEIILILIVLVHIWFAVQLTLENWLARPVGYKVKKRAGQSTIMSRYMIYSGLVILNFIVLHVVSFKFGAWDNQQIRFDNTLYDHVVQSFSNAGYSGFYVFSMILLGFHLHHAVKSLLITLGLVRKSTLKLVSNLSCLFAVVIAAGFSSFPVYFYLQSLS